MAFSFEVWLKTLTNLVLYSLIVALMTFALSWLFSVQEKSNREIELTYKLKVLQQELDQEETSHKSTRALLADKSKIKVTIEGAKSESMKGETTNHLFGIFGAKLHRYFLYLSEAQIFSRRHRAGNSNRMK